MAERKRIEQDGYIPTVTVTTFLEDRTGGQGSDIHDSKSAILSVTDNGKGIPKDIVDKIFQPFFTTKPTGEGTGLGLSLSYDIVKAHGGTLKVESKPNEYTRFTIEIPVNNFS